MTDERLQHQISVLLRIGITVSGVLMAIGFVLLYLNGIPPETADVRSGWHLFPALFQRGIGPAFANPLLYLFTGIVTLMLTPILRVIFTLSGFALEKDGRYTLISSVVLVVITISIIFSITH